MWLKQIKSLKMDYNILKSCFLILIFTFSFNNVKATRCLGCPGTGSGGGGGSSSTNCATYSATDTLFVDASRPNNTGSGKSWASAKRDL